MAILSPSGRGKPNRYRPRKYRSYPEGCSIWEGDVMPEGMQRAKGACERRQPIQGGTRGDQFLNPSLN